MLFVGITGGVGAGKSEILNYLRTNYNSKVMLTDEIAHDLMEPGTDCYERLKAIFDTDKLLSDPAMAALFEQEPEFSVYNADGTFNRPNLAKVIFSDEGKRDALNAIVHPAVKQYVIDQYEIEKARAEGREVLQTSPEQTQNQREQAQDQQEQATDNGALDLLVVESALLIDDNYDVICEEMWYIYTSQENRRARLKASRGYSDEKVQSIFDSQLSEEEFRRHCGEVIDNNGTPADAFAQIKEILASREIYEEVFA